MRTYVLTYCLTWSDQNRAYGGTYPKHKYGILSILTPRLSPLSKSTYGYDGALTKLSNGYLRDGALLFFDSYRSDTYLTEPPRSGWVYRGPRNGASRRHATTDAEWYRWSFLMVRGRGGGAFWLYYTPTEYAVVFYFIRRSHLIYVTKRI